MKGRWSFSSRRFATRAVDRVVEARASEGFVILADAYGYGSTQGGRTHRDVLPTTGVTEKGGNTRYPFLSRTWRAGIMIGR